MIVGANEGSTQFAPVGTWFDEDGANFISSDPAWFLRMYYAAPNPIRSADDVAVDWSQTDEDGLPFSKGCEIDNPSDPWPGGVLSPPAPSSGPDGSDGSQCIYPLAVQVQPGVEEGGNIPLAASCLASFNPTP